MASRCVIIFTETLQFKPSRDCRDPCNLSEVSSISFGAHFANPFYKHFQAKLVKHYIPSNIICFISEMGIFSKSTSIHYYLLCCRRRCHRCILLYYILLFNQ